VLAAAFQEESREGSQEPHHYGRQGVGTKSQRLLCSRVESVSIPFTHKWLKSRVENVPSGYSNSLVKDKISKVRTDLDGFSDAESAILENHGYLLAAAATQRYAPNLAQSTAPISPPHPGWMNEAQVEQALARSHERSVPGRGWLSASNRRPS
jgi:hypothetical protein